MIRTLEEINLEFQRTAAFLEPPPAAAPDVLSAPLLSADSAMAAADRAKPRRIGVAVILFLILIFVILAIFVVPRFAGNDVPAEAPPASDAAADTAPPQDLPVPPPAEPVREQPQTAVSGLPGDLYRDITETPFQKEAASVSNPETLLSKENKALLLENINAFLLENSGGTVSAPPRGEVNANAAFTSYTAAAAKLAKTDWDKAALQEIIALRSKALEVYRLRNLLGLLANNYESLGLLSGDSADDARDAFLRSVSFRTECLHTLHPASKNYYLQIYCIGRTFSEIARIRDLDANEALHASLIASCFLEIASTNTNPIDSEGLLFYSSYYAGMENQRLLSAVSKDTSEPLINDALRFYLRSFEAGSYRRQRSLQRRWVEQLAAAGIRYTELYGNTDGYLSQADFSAVKSAYSD
ncbi:MAG: hypothetical protein LBT26_03690 [Clostridiales Family XIII bacterium]|jgi:hypothetical protein|nr:hypothetical protein [Clostridiales Family XIII bacterium]